MLVVIDTNVLVSAFWSSNGIPAKIIGLTQNRIITPCYDYRIINEYRDVLSRAKFGFCESEIADFMSQIEHDGLSVVAEPLTISFIDESDRMFYEVAKYCGALLITGNKKHYPIENTVMSPADFMEKYNK